MIIIKYSNQNFFWSPSQIIERRYFSLTCASPGCQINFVVSFPSNQEMEL